MKSKGRDGTRRVKTNDELYELIRHKNIINHMKAQKLSWFCHLQRMQEERIVKKNKVSETDVNTTTRETKEHMGR